MDVQQTHQYGYHNIIMYLDRGLQAHALADVLAIVRSCACYVDEMPFPIVVNTVLLRLAETFQGEKFNSKLEFLNIVRLNIVKSVREFRNHLHVAFSSDEIVRCVMKVSHSNDFHARSLTLLFLAALAPLVSDNKKAHHLLIESLDCGEESELSAAIQAVTEFGRHSSNFCTLVVEKIGKVLCSSQTSFEVKLQLLNVVANFKESFAVAHACFQLSTRLLQCTFNRILHVVIFNASTTLAARSCLVVGEQIALLLSELDRAILNNSNMLTLCLLRNLARLADFPQHWLNTQILALRDMFERICEMRSRKGICAWLNCMEVLTSTGVHCDSVVEKDFSWITLLKSEDLTLRISGIRLLINVMQNGSSKEHLRGIFLFVVTETIAEISRISARYQSDGGESSEFRNAEKRFYQSISAFSRMPQCTSQNALCIVHELTRHSTLNSLVLRSGDSNSERTEKSTMKTAQESLNMLVQMLCSICDAHPAHCAPFAAKWALKQFVEFVEHQVISNVSGEERDDDSKRAKRQRLEKTSKLVGDIPFSLYNLVLAPNLSITFHKADAGPSEEAMDVDGVELTEANAFERFLTAFDQMVEYSPTASKTSDEIGFGANGGATVLHGWTRYKIARCAFHYGHWRRVALPLFLKLRISCESLETSSWINALINIAKSQIADSESFSVNKLNETYKYLRNAFLIFQRLAATPRRGEHCFGFAAAYVNCMAMSWQAIRLVLSALNFKLLALSQYLPQHDTENKIPTFCIEQLCDSLFSVRGNVAAAHTEWTSLFHRSFDADAQTLEHIHLWIQFMLIIENILLFSCAQPMRSILLTNSDFGGNAKASTIIGATTKRGRGIRGAANHNFHALLVSLKRVLDALLQNSEIGTSESDSIRRQNTATSGDANEAKISRADVLQKRLSLENLRTIKEMLLSLKHFPLSLPRFFFQRTFHTQIKLNVSPAPREADSNSVSISTPLLPLTIEGVIQSNNAKRIESVTVLADVQCLMNTLKSFMDKRIIELEDGENYFKTQFLLKITEPVTKVHVRLLFTDSTTKRNWVDESAVAELTVQYHEGVAIAKSQ